MHIGRLAAHNRYRVRDRSIEKSRGLSDHIEKETAFCPSVCLASRAFVSVRVLIYFNTFIASCAVVECAADGGGGSGGLSKNAKIAIGVGVGVGGLLVLILVAVALSRVCKRSGYKSV